MTGWRLGYGIFPVKLYEIAEKLAVNIHSSVNASAQFAALEALKRNYQFNVLKGRSDKCK